MMSESAIPRIEKCIVHFMVLQLSEGPFSPFIQPLHFYRDLMTFFWLDARNCYLGLAEKSIIS